MRTTVVHRVLLAAALVGTATAAAPVAAAEGQGGRRIDIRSPYTDPEGNLDGFHCTGLSEQPPVPHERTCTGDYVGYALFTGGFQGRQDFRLDTWLDRETGDIEYEGVVQYVNTTIPGCGTGSFLQRETEGRIHTRRMEPDGTMPGFNKWEIVPGSATGGLEGRLLSGSGVNNWTAQFANSGGRGDIGVGVFTGFVICR